MTTEKTYAIHSKEEYEKMKSRVKKGHTILDGKWFDPDPKIQRWIYEFEQMGIACLNWEIENDLLPI